MLKYARTMSSASSIGRIQQYRGATTGGDMDAAPSVISKFSTLPKINRSVCHCHNESAHRCCREVAGPQQDHRGVCNQGPGLPDPDGAIWLPHLHHQCRVPGLTEKQASENPVQGSPDICHNTVAGVREVGATDRRGSGSSRTTTPSASSAATLRSFFVVEVPRSVRSCLQYVTFNNEEEEEEDEEEDRTNVCKQDHTKNQNLNSISRAGGTGCIPTNPENACPSSIAHPTSSSLMVVVGRWVAVVAGIDFVLLLASLAASVVAESVVCEYKPVMLVESYESLVLRGVRAGGEHQESSHRYHGAARTNQDLYDPGTSVLDKLVVGYSDSDPSSVAGEPEPEGGPAWRLLVPVSLWIAYVCVELWSTSLLVRIHRSVVDVVCSACGSGPASACAQNDCVWWVVFRSLLLLILMVVCVCDAVVRGEASCSCVVSVTFLVVRTVVGSGPVLWVLVALLVRGDREPPNLATRSKPPNEMYV